MTLSDADIRDLRGRRVRIIGDADPVGIETVNRIAAQLTAAREVQVLNLAGLRRVDGEAVKDLFDATRLDCDAFEANHDLSCVTDLNGQGPRVLVFPKVAEFSLLPPSAPSKLLSFSDSMRASPITESASMRGCLAPSGDSGESMFASENKCLQVKDSIGLEQILAGTIPNQRGETNRQLFTVARRIRQAEELAKLPLLALRREVAVAWLERARGFVDPTFDVELVELQLSMKMKCVKTLSNPLTVALATLDTSSPINHPDIPPGSKLERLARLCRNLAQQLGGTFALSTRDAARVVGYSDNHAGIALLQKLEGIVITCIDKGKQHVGAKASRFQYLLPLEGTHK